LAVNEPTKPGEVRTVRKADSGEAEPADLTALCVTVTHDSREV